MINRFIEYIESGKRYSKLTVRNYKRDVLGFAEWFNDRIGLDKFDATKVSAEDIRDWIIYRLDTAELSAASMNRELSSIKSLFSYLRRIGVVEKDITKRISSLKTPKVLPQFVPQSRMDELLESTREQKYSQEFK